MTRSDHEMDFWIPERIWAGQRAFIMASGPSLTRDVAERVRGRRTIVINSSYPLAPWADILFFTDNSWFVNHKADVMAWPGEVMTLSRHAKRDAPERVKRLQGETRPQGFPHVGAAVVRQGTSSGHSAIGLAVALGAAEIVLLGYDMRVVDGREHHHTEYLQPDGSNKRDMSIYPHRFLPGFEHWNAQALAAGVKVWNATPGSALTEFEAVDLAAML